MNTDGQAQAPVDSTVKVDDVVVKIEEIGGDGGDKPDKVATVSPNGDVQLRLARAVRSQLAARKRAM